MKLAFSTNAYTRFSLTDALEGIKAAGFEGVEILADTPHAYPDAIDDALVKDVNRALERLKLQVSNVNCNCSFGYWKDAPGEPYFEPSLISPNPKHREDRSRMILKALAFAKQIGARNISITSGRCLGGMPPDAAAKQFEESMQPILERAEQLGIDVGIELEPGLFLEYAPELDFWINTKFSNHSRFGANLDIGHSQVLGEDLPFVIELLGQNIWNMHVEDIPGRKHYHLIPGEGTMPWLAIKKALQKIQYDRYLTVELYTHTQDPQAAAEKSFAFLSQHFA
ncbi:MAG TPA: sugar phosphate isomerase/epimerase family protein [Tepidisphaeraceae bacterium]|jgi:sugar phosphate isomerase/epimerase|nr:sugar phosphate isomerase/epimerase family protein [Tepidisphaeraceae bacterium]